MDAFLNALRWSAAVGAVTLLVLTLKGPLDRRFTPKWRYWLWLVLALALLLSPVRWESLVPAIPKPAVTVAVPQVRLSVPSRRPSGAPVSPTISGGEDGTYSDAMPAAPAPPAPSAPQKSVALSTLLISLWILGAAVFILRHALGTALLSRRARRWSAPAGADITELAGIVRRELGIRRPVTPRVSRGVGSPMVMGLIRPRLWLPDREYEPRELEFILRHELTHIKRRDLWYKALMLLANAVHWFDPAIWLMRRDAAETAELLCDSQALAGAGPETAREYCEALLTSIRRERGSALTTHFYGGEKSVKRRFKNLLGNHRRKYGWSALVVAVLAVAVCAGAVGLSQSAGKAPAETPSPSLPAAQDPSGLDERDPPESTDPENIMERGFAVKLTDPASPDPVVEGEGSFLAIDDLRVAAEGVSFSVGSRVTVNDGCLAPLRDLAAYDPARDGSWDNRRETTPEDRAALDGRFQVYVNGVKMSGELIFGLGNGHQDYEFRFDTPLDPEALSGAEVYIAVGDPLWVADHGLVYFWSTPINFTNHCDVYYTENAHIYYCWQSGVMHGGTQALTVVWADGHREEYLSKLPSLGPYEFSLSYYAADISLSPDGNSLYFSAPDYTVTGDGDNAVLTSNGLATYLIDLTTAALIKAPTP